MCEVQEWIVIVWSCIVAVISYPLMVYFCISINKHKNDLSETGQNKFTRKITIVGIFSFVSLFMCVQMRCISKIFICVQGFESVADIWLNILTLGGLFYFCGFFGLLYMLLIRLKDTFYGRLSEFAPSKSSMKCVYGWYIGTISLLIICLIIFAIIGNGSWAGIALSLIFVSCISLYGVLWFMVSKKLMMVVAARVDRMDENTSNASNTNNTSNTKNDSNSNAGLMIDVGSIESLVRFTLVIIIGFTSTVIFIIAKVFYAAISNKVFEIEFADGLWVTDALINQICIVFLFGFSTNLYHRACNVFDKCLRNIIIKRIQHDDQKKANNVHTKQEYENLIFGQN